MIAHRAAREEERIRAAVPELPSTGGVVWLRPSSGNTGVREPE
jgi:hypothetical protein